MLKDVGKSRLLGMGRHPRGRNLDGVVNADKAPEAIEIKLPAMNLLPPVVAQALK
jgi:hypothetical protein